MTTTPHILVVDDDAEIRGLLSGFLARHDLRVTTAACGSEMKAALANWAIDLIVLDVMMPAEDGLTLCRDLRGRGSNVPVIMLTAMGEETDRIVGLEMGADDYLPKPFNSRELLARIKAVLRRSGNHPGPAADTEKKQQTITFAGWTFDLESRELTSPEGIRVELSGGEFQLLEAFVTHPGRVLSRDQLLDLARGREAAPFDRAIDVQVSRLRRKIEADPKSPLLVKTVRAGGYLFTPSVKPA